MALLARLAVRNLWRNRRRTVITFSALSLGIAMLVVFHSISTGFSNVGFQNVRDFQTGEVQVHAVGYFEERDRLPLEPLLPAAPALAAVADAAGVEAVTPRLVTGARLHAGWEEFPVTAIAIDPERDGTVFRLQEHVYGRMPQAGAAEAVIGSTLAEWLDIELGDFVLLIARTRQESLQAVDLEVVGIARTPDPSLNQGHVYFPLDVADDALGLDGHVTELIIRTDEGRIDAAVAAVRQALAARGVEAEVFRWEEAAAELLVLMQVDTVGNLILTGVIMLIALVGVTNTILLGVLERKPEIGIMKALGFRERHIVGLFLAEAVGIGLLAVLTGSALGALINGYFVTHGLDMDAWLGETDWGIPVIGTVYGVWNPQVFLWGAVAGIVTCCLAAYWPARYAARLPAAEAVRG